MYPPTEGLSLSQKGELWDAVFRYHSGVEPEINDPMVCMAFSFFRQSFERDAERYEEIKEKRRIAGSLGGQAKASNDKQMLANATFAKQSQANLAVNVNDNDNVIINTPLPPSSSEEGDTREQGDSSNAKQGKQLTKQQVLTLDPDPGFEQVWRAYPRNAEKKQAWCTYYKLRRDTSEFPSPDELCEAIRWKKASGDWEDERYIPHMATWLNRRGWEDESCQSPRKLTPEQEAIERQLDENAKIYKKLWDEETAFVKRNLYQDLIFDDMEELGVL